MKKYTPSNIKKKEILSVALKISESIGYHNISFQEMQRHGGVFPSTISRLFGNIENLKERTIQEAINQKNTVVIVQALACNSQSIRAVSREFLKKTIETFLECYV